ncbi:hypothetical protein N7492_000552 [Penicillium capsulatum]|uniref:Membrane insertase YidC/Oxa/ALB C-terminal domain-containing protein n=1 Tax=Penicillium capsulatum TaxID=69766 RepID=A0A9W9LYM6_9EURO|nr:hypothetical protein N7492_000552 [Penicillium capsulatum]KAJ6130390.1 hypothetical protein N7512_003170 [Penicillium capsulatum]
MIGPAGLNGPSVAAAIMRQRLMAVPRSTRSMSTFRIQRMRMPGQRAQLNPVSSYLTPWTASSAAIGPSAIRFNSTSAAETTTSSLPPPALDDLSTLDISAIPEKIGYLKSLGLDYGWGPASVMEWLIEHIHIWGGLPWWASIITLGILTRAALLKPMLDASDNGAKLHNIKHLTAPLRSEIAAAMSGESRNPMQVQMKQAELRELNKQHGIKSWKSFVPMLQIPLAFGMFRVIRGMASLPVPGLANESVMWLTDLTVADPLYVLPALTSFFLYLSLKRGGEAGMAELMSGSLGKAMIYGLPAMSMAFMAFVPSALQLYFVSTGLFAVGQAYLMHSHAFRRWMNMAIPQRATNQSDDSTLRLTRNVKAQLEHARRIEKAKQGQDQNISFIDRNAGLVKDWMNKATGKNTKAADGSNLPPPRITEAERKKAEMYEKQQRVHDYEELENRNKQRWDAYAETRESQKIEQWREAQWREMERARAKVSARK